MTFLMENLSTVIIGLILAGVVYLVVRKMIRDRREAVSYTHLDVYKRQAADICKTVQRLAEEIPPGVF